MFKRLLRIGLPLVIVAGFVWSLQGEGELTVASVYQTVKSAGYWTVLYFILLYCGAVLLFLPTPVFTLAGGALFGPIGILINLFSLSLGASLAFLIGRYLSSDWIYRFQNKRVQQVIQGVDEEGWRFVAVVRLLPFMPFDALSYAMGLTRIGFWHYALATTISCIPAISAYSLVGYVGGAALQGKEDIWGLGLVALLLILLVGYLPRFIALLGVGLNIRNHHQQLRKRV